MDQSVVIAIDHSPQSENAVKCERSSPFVNFRCDRFIVRLVNVPEIAYYEQISGKISDILRSL